MGCTVALLTISHDLQKSLDAGMESYIVQLDFNVAFDRVSHNWCRWQCAVHLYRVPPRP